ncbi:MAG: type II CAAX endopeptidase family protein [Alphaproteobacteria bacterium]|nr:type II CAAX endopeptidase family protein [Alphaproteobacteria bacterium]
MRTVAISILKILAFLGIWAALTSGAVLATVSLGGDSFYTQTRFRVGLEVVLTIVVVAALMFMARAVDKRSLRTIGFASGHLHELLVGTVVGAAIFAIPLAALLLMGAARLTPDLEGFSAQALGIGVFVCFFNVVTQEVLVRGYFFQELWGKYGAWVATLVTTVFFVALHAAAIQHGVQGLIAGANILFASLLLSLAYVRTGSLWLPIGIHLGWNGLQGPVLGINVTGLDLGFGHWSLFTFPGDALLTGGEMGIEGGLAGLIGPLVGIAVIALTTRQQPKPNFGADEKYRSAAPITSPSPSV